MTPNRDSCMIIIQLNSELYVANRPFGRSGRGLGRRGPCQPAAYREMAHAVFAYFRMDSKQKPGTLSPDPWHFALSASSMIAVERLSFMLLAQSVKCRGLGCRAPKGHGSMQEPDEPKQDVAPLQCRDDPELADGHGCTCTLSAPPCLCGQAQWHGWRTCRAKRSQFANGQIRDN